MSVPSDPSTGKINPTFNVEINPYLALGLQSHVVTPWGVTIVLPTFLSLPFSQSLVMYSLECSCHPLRAISDDLVRFINE